MTAKSIIEDKERLAAAFLGLLKLQNEENSEGKFKITLEYNNYHDGAVIINGDGENIGECFVFDIFDDWEDDDEYFPVAQHVIAIERALAAKKDKNE